MQRSHLEHLGRDGDRYIGNHRISLGIGEAMKNSVDLNKAMGIYFSTVPALPIEILTNWSVAGRNEVLMNHANSSVYSDK